jgi:hypothetical protein
MTTKNHVFAVSRGLVGRFGRGFEVSNGDPAKDKKYHTGVKKKSWDIWLKPDVILMRVGLEPTPLT